jgi:hypothetical protein
MAAHMPTVRIGSGAGFSGDRIAPAVDLAARGDLDDLVLECLAERTIALGHRRRMRDPSVGYDPALVQRLSALLPVTVQQGTRILTNMGAANPIAAGNEAVALAGRLDLTMTIAVITGDDVLDRVDLNTPALETGRPLGDHGPVISANAYLGADAVMPALTAGADLVITGRLADPSLFLAPLADRLGWELSRWPLVAAGTMVGHLLECAGQVSGGYFADPDCKHVPDLAHLGFPYADVRADGSAVISKLPGTGGRIDRATVREQLLYEITDPRAYLTPDVELDLRETRVREVDRNGVRVDGAIGRPAPHALKVNVGYHAGYRAEAEISYMGPTAEKRARLAGEVVATRLNGIGAQVRLDLIGCMDGAGEESDTLRDRECRLRVAAMGSAEDAAAVCQEVEALYTNGPAGGGGVRTDIDEVIGIVSTLLPRDQVQPQLTILEAQHARKTA